MKRRDFVKTTSLVTLGTVLNPLAACKEVEKDSSNSNSSNSFTPFTLPALGFEFNALEPLIDSETMTIHHGKHHAGYVKKLNASLENHSLAGKSLEEMFGLIGKEKADSGLRNSGGGHFNHSLFWKILKPGGKKEVSGTLLEAINSSFGSFDSFKKEFSKAAATRFGSGWAWLSMDTSKKLFVSSTPNQDNPLMSKLVQKTGIPILGIDVWEHAYYLHYQNRRKEYIQNFFEIINWDQVSENFLSLK